MIDRGCQLWRDERGFVASADLILISTILLLGVIVGLVTVRDQIVQELGDLGSAVGNLNQSYSFSGFTGTDELGNPVGTVAGSRFVDQSDLCDNGGLEGSDPSNGDAAGQPPNCISVTIPASTEEA